MRTHRFIGMLAVGALALTGASSLRAQQTPYGGNQTANQAQRGQLSEKDYRFLTDAANGGMEEVQLGQLAKEKGGNQAVRTFGEHMIADHTKANDELKQIASQKGAAIPAQMSHSERSTLEHLQNLTGTDFDKAYAKDMVKDHKKDVSEFEKAAQNLTDTDLRAFAEKTLGTLRQHLSMAEDLENQVKTEK